MKNFLRIPMFCPHCHSIMFFKEEKFHCGKCGHSQFPGAHESYAPAREKKETAVVEEEIQTQPVAKVTCSACGNHEAYWILKQTRAADEPETRIYTCTACGHKWREY